MGSELVLMGSGPVQMGAPFRSQWALGRSCWVPMGSGLSRWVPMGSVPVPMGSGQVPVVSGPVPISRPGRTCSLIQEASTGDAMKTPGDFASNVTDSAPDPPKSRTTNISVLPIENKESRQAAGRSINGCRPKPTPDHGPGLATRKLREPQHNA